MSAIPKKTAISAFLAGSPSADEERTTPQTADESRVTTTLQIKPSIRRALEDEQERRRQATGKRPSLADLVEEALALWIKNRTL